MPILSNTLAENEFVYDGSAGEGSTLYVLDTGTHAGHFVSHCFERFSRMKLILCTRNSQRQVPTAG